MIYLFFRPSTMIILILWPPWCQVFTLFKRTWTSQLAGNEENHHQLCLTMFTGTIFIWIQNIHCMTYISIFINNLLILITAKSPIEYPMTSEKATSHTGASWYFTRRRATPKTTRSSSCGNWTLLPGRGGRGLWVLVTECRRYRRRSFPASGHHSTVSFMALWLTKYKGQQT